jgi:probable rRNA maturation factor
MPLLIRSQRPTKALNRRRLKELARKLLLAERRSESLEVSLYLCDDETIQSCNREYRGQDKPTDVLSFNQEEGEALPLGMADDALPAVLGDILISLDTAKRQAEEYQWSLQEEVEALLTHGLLHLLGYDHETAEEEALMREREKALLGNRCIWVRENQTDSPERDAH